MTITQRKIMQTLVLMAIVLNIACSTFYNLVDPTLPRGAEANLYASDAYATQRASIATLEASDAAATEKASRADASRHYDANITLLDSEAFATYSAQAQHARATYEASDAMATWRAAEATYQASDAMATFRASR